MPRPTGPRILRNQLVEMVWKERKHGHIDAEDVFCELFAASVCFLAAHGRPKDELIRNLEILHASGSKATTEKKSA